MKQRRKRQTTYTMLDELMASGTEPMPAAARYHQLTAMHLALQGLEMASEPTKNDWRLVADAVNLFETLVNMGEVEDSSKLLADAVKALGDAGARFFKHGKIRLDGQGITAVRAVLEDYATVLEALPHRIMIRCHRLTEKRIFEIISGNKKQHDVTVCAL
jgi:hypothetical protein